MTARTILVFILLDVGFRVLGFPRVFRLVDRWGRRPADSASPAEQGAQVHRVVEAVRIATRYYWRVRRDCLPRAMATYVLLRQRGLPATLHVGVKRYPFGGHAWVECLGKVLDDSAGGDWRHEPYVPILSTGDEPV